MNSEKIAELAPMPKASETIATVVTNGVLNSIFKAKRRLGIVSVLDGIGVHSVVGRAEPRNRVLSR